MHASSSSAAPPASAWGWRPQWPNAAPSRSSCHASSPASRALSQLPEHARGTTVDLTDLSAVEQLAVDIGDIEHLVFTAGESLELAPLAELTPDTINRFFQTRFVGALTAVPVFAPRITPGGSITMTSGTAAEQYGFGVLPVSICNAMNGATKALAVELADVARAYLYCMEQEFGTGVILTVDGGTTLV